MRIHRKTLLQITIAAAVGLGVIHLHQQAGGPGDDMVPDLLGFFIASLVTLGPLGSGPTSTHEFGFDRD
jgi:hypothetical protein